MKQLFSQIRTGTRCLTTAACMLMMCGGNLYAQQESTPQEADTYEWDPIILFEHATELMKDGQYSKAATRFAESYALGPSGGTLLNLGICYSRLGKRFLAWRTLQDALVRAERDQRDDRKTAAQAELNKLEVSFPMVMVSIDGQIAALQGAQVTIDGVRWLERHWGAAIPIDVGRHVVTVSAPGYTQFYGVLIVEATTRIATVIVPPLQRVTIEERRGATPVRSGAGHLQVTKRVLPGTSQSLPRSSKTVVSRPLMSRRQIERGGHSLRIAGTSLAALGFLGVSVGLGLASEPTGPQVAKKAALGFGGTTTAFGLGLCFFGFGPTNSAGRTEIVYTRPPTVSFAISPRGAAVIGTF